MADKKIKKYLGIAAVALGASFAVLSVAAKKNKGNSVYDNEPEQKNPMAGKKVEFVEDENDEENADGVRGHLVEVGISDREDVGGKQIENISCDRCDRKEIRFSVCQTACGSC